MRSIKCVVVGDGAVGKTSLLISYTTNSFPEDYIPTVFDNYTTTIALEDINSPNGTHQIYKLHLWDTAGQEEYDRLRPLSYPQTDIFIICFSVNERASFHNAFDKWFPEIRHNTNTESTEWFLKSGKYPILLVGTKADLRDSAHEEDRLREINEDFVSRAEIKRLVTECGFMGYVECSAATQEGVVEVFETAVRCVIYEQDGLLRRNHQGHVAVNTTSAFAYMGDMNDDENGIKNASNRYGFEGGSDGAAKTRGRGQSSKAPQSPKKKTRKVSKCVIL
ncbi:HBR513Wp [Eremothecium sinecaudum]|uniref:HBR513Wp n=1 Tax=Eremothecium sinecaudum TaxID=45286 RepID=A0A120K1H9_9SACH|nr:HBR513Wp [Eremothecium sinecaudum]AMD19414.1 HBR513Wp [Eremothecium sinecaudum]